MGQKRPTFNRNGGNKPSLDSIIHIAMAPNPGDNSDTVCVGDSRVSSLSSSQIIEMSESENELDFMVAVINGNLNSFKMVHNSMVSNDSFLCISSTSEKKINFFGKINHFSINLPENESEEEILLR